MFMEQFYFVCFVIFGKYFNLGNILISEMFMEQFLRSVGYMLFCNWNCVYLNVGYFGKFHGKIL